MKKFTSLLIGCCLALAGAAMAQQPQEQQTPTEKHGGAKGHHQAAEAQPGANQANPAAGAGKRRGPKNQGAVSTEQNVQQPGTGAQGRGQGRLHGQAGGKRMKKSEGAADQSGATASATPNVQQQQQVEQGAKGKHGRNAHRGENATNTGAATGAAATGAGATGAAATSATGAVMPNNAQAGQANAGRGARKKLEPQQVQQIKQQHASFRAQPKPDKVPAVTYNQNYRIQGADHWQGPRYEVFRSYHPEWHDEGWYRSHYSRVELIGGGYYFFNNGYWFPAWGYSPSAQYYAYDGPIYVGQRAVPPDQVIADVQAALQDMGYYRGEVDGLAGPLTREALAAYQADQGLAQTAAIDEPTLESLGMA